jgi:two-component system response regulator PilR (NtrC family)
MTSPRARDAALDRLVGESEAMRNVKQRIAKVARSMAPVLVRGRIGHRQGAGGARVARLQPPRRRPVHGRQLRRHPREPAGSRIFWRPQRLLHRRHQDRDGYFQAARGGTLFLDEIGDLPLAMQSKLLRAIQERSVRPLGSTQEETVDVRVVSATHKDLAADVQAGRFRQDLYYRLNVIEIVPPLRERREDLPALCDALLARIAQESGMPVPRLSERCWPLCSAPPDRATCASWRTCCTGPWP